MRQLSAFITYLRELPWHVLGRIFWLTVLAVLFVAAVPGSRPDLGDENVQTLGIARQHLFDFPSWEAGALLEKNVNAALGAYRYMSDEERVAYVTEYLQLVYDIAQLEIQVEQVYVDPTVDDPQAATADIRAQRDAMRAQQHERQALAESIIQSQISEMLVEQGFGVGGQVLPPVALRFTELPTILIVSPRDRIERTGAYPLEHGLTVDVMESIESDIDQSLNVSSIIEPLGGLAVYPAMLIETGYAPHVYDIGAHEWAHHYLSFFPLGFNYGVTPELYTINETVARIVGNEVGWAVLDRYYPEFAGPPPDYTPPPPPDDSQPEAEQAPDAEPPTFDYRAEMRETRVRTDELLAAGQIEQAEAYMEARRVIFVEHGYQIRKINQAYFAFHGAYADQPGATGSDPIGPMINELRYYSPSLHAFIQAIRGVTTVEELQTAVAEAKQAYEAGQ